MANREVNLTKRIWDVHARNKQGHGEPGYRYCPVVLSANGRIKRDVVLIDGRRNAILKGPITWNGVTAPRGTGYRSAKMQRTPMHGGWPKKPS